MDDPQILSLLTQMRALGQEVNKLINAKIEAAKVEWEGRYVIISGEKGWTRGIVKAVSCRSLGYRYYSVIDAISLPKIDLIVQHESSTKLVEMDKSRLMNDEEIAKYQQAIEIDRRINMRERKFAEKQKDQNINET
jgi:hypothetical protein